MEYRTMNYEAMLTIAYEEAKVGFDEGGVPVGAALFDMADFSDEGETAECKTMILLCMGRLTLSVKLDGKQITEIKF